MISNAELISFGIGFATCLAITISCKLINIICN